MMCFSAFLLFIFSGLVGYMAVALSGVDVLKYVPVDAKPDKMGNPQQEYKFNDLVIGGGLIICGITFILSFWACCTKMCKSKVCLFPFTLIALIVFVAYAITGAFLVF